MRLQLAAWLALGLAASLGLNVFLGWQWAEAGAECDATTAQAANQALRDEWKRMEGADRRALEIGRAQGEATAQARRDAQQDTDQRDQTYRRVPVTGACRMPDGLPDLRPAVDAARAAAGD